jgi:methyl-accepting chemotaxis protein
MDSFLSQFRTRSKLAAGFGVLIAFLLGIGAYSMYSSHQLSLLLHDMYHVRVNAITLMDEANLLAVRHNRTLFSLAAEQDPGVVDDIKREMGEYETEVMRRIDTFAKSGDLSDKELAAVKNIKDNWPQYVGKVETIETSVRGGNTASAMMILQGSVQNVFALIDKDLSDIVTINKQRAQEADAQGVAIAARIRQVTIALMALAVVLGIVIAAAVTRNITGPLSRAVAELRTIAEGDMTAQIEVHGSDESATMMASLRDVQGALSGLVAQIQNTTSHLHSSVHDVTESSHQLSRRAAESSDAISSAAASVEELAVSIDLVGNNADEANHRASDAGSAAARGRALGVTASGDVTRAADKVGQTADMIQHLSTQVADIGTIANVIKDIADQTNLLALNAAIEAARAGEQGRGFAVVADEVRKLAERTTVSAQEITSTIGAIQSGTNAVVVSMSESRETMNEVRNKVAQTTEAISLIEDSTSSAVAATEVISTALREQKSSSGGITRSVENVARLSEENARTAESVSHSMADVRQVAEQLAAIIARFKVRG